MSYSFAISVRFQCVLCLGFWPAALAHLPKEGAQTGWLLGLEVRVLLSGGPQGPLVEPSLSFPGQNSPAPFPLVTNSAALIDPLSPMSQWVQVAQATSNLGTDLGKKAYDMRLTRKRGDMWGARDSSHLPSPLGRRHPSPLRQGQPGNRE